MNMGHEVGFLVDHGGVDCGDYRVLGHGGPWNVVPCWSIWLWRPVMHRKDPFFSWLDLGDGMVKNRITWKFWLFLCKNAAEAAKK